MTIKTFRKYGEIWVTNTDDTAVMLNFKFIPSIDEVGICVGDSDVNASYGFWIETIHSVDTNAFYIQAEFPWLAEGEAERIATEIAEWVK